MSDAFLSFIIIILYFLLYLITILGTNMSHIKNNWDLYRCNPLIVPFASYFGVDAEDNMQQCTMTTQSSFMDAFLKPIHEMQSASIKNQQILYKSQKSSNATTNKHRGLVAYMTGGMFNKVNNVLIEMNRTDLIMKDNMSRIQGLFVTVFYMFRTLGLATESAGNIMREFPSCFPKDTIIPTLHDGMVPIQHLTPGTILPDESIVTATMILDGSTQSFFELDSTTVTGSHKVLYRDKWICVKDHPDAISLPHIDGPIYCFNTTSKIIKLNNTIFSDWDDLEEKDLVTLNNACGKSLPEPLVFSNIHQYLEMGFHPNTTVQLHDGTDKLIKHIQVGEILADGGIVTGCVTIQGDVPLYYHDDIIGTYHLNPANPPIIPSTHKTPLLHHLLTTTGQMRINKHLWSDYNDGLERFF